MPGTLVFAQCLYEIQMIAKIQRKWNGKKIESL